jgi:putative SOS response-associated peptidase YedK
MRSVRPPERNVVDGPGNSLDGVCGRFTSKTPSADLAEYFDVDEVVAPDLGARFNVAPTDETYTIAASADGTRRLGTFRWGLVPFWSKDAKGGAKMINARAEGLIDKPAFKRAFERKRCIVPADGFYEWKRLDSKRKQPWYITRADGAPMAFAGLWDSWRPNKDSDDGKIRSCTIITGAPNEKVAELHDRMPVMLAPDVWEAWLDPDNHDLGALQGLLVPAPADVLVLRPVSTAVNTVTNDGPELIEPADEGDGTLFS